MVLLWFWKGSFGFLGFLGISRWFVTFQAWPDWAWAGAGWPVLQCVSIFSQSRKASGMLLLCMKSPLLLCHDNPHIPIQIHRFP